MARDYYSEMKGLSNMLLTFAEDGDIDIMLRFVPKFVELQKYLTDNHDALVNDEDYSKTNSQLATLITYVAERIEKHAEKTYPKDSAEYKQNMLLAYETAIKADLRYLDKHDAYYRQYFMDRIKCKAFDLYEKELKLEVTAPTTIVKGAHFEVTYSYNQEGKNFKIEENPNVHKSTGPIADQKYVPTFKTTLKYNFVCFKEGIFEIPRASVQIDGETLQFPARHITVNPKVVSTPVTNTTIPQSHSIDTKPTVTETPTTKLEEDSVSEVQFEEVKQQKSSNRNEDNATPSFRGAPNSSSEKEVQQFKNDILSKIAAYQKVDEEKIRNGNETVTPDKYPIWKEPGVFWSIAAIIAIIIFIVLLTMIPDAEHLRGGKETFFIGGWLFFGGTSAIYLGKLLDGYINSKPFRLPSANGAFPSHLGTINNIGITMLGGFRWFGGSCVVYEFVCFFVALFPVGCYRAKVGATTKSGHKTMSTSYRFYGSEKMNGLEILQIYLMSWGWLPFIIGLICMVIAMFE